MNPSRNTWAFLQDIAIHPDTTYANLQGVMQTSNVTPAQRVILEEYWGCYHLGPDFYERNNPNYILTDNLRQVGHCEYCGNRLLDEDRKCKYCGGPR